LNLSDNTFTSEVIRGVVIALIVAGILFYLATMRKRSTVTGASTTQPIHQMRYMPLMGVYRANGTPVGNMEEYTDILYTENSPIPINTDYLSCAPTYVPALSPVNLSPSRCYPCDGGIIYRADTNSTYPIGTAGTCTVPDRLAIDSLSCTPKTNVNIPPTCVI
jgi:hypothetical protein